MRIIKLITKLSISNFPGPEREYANDIGKKKRKFSENVGDGDVVDNNNPESERKCGAEI